MGGSTPEALERVGESGAEELERVERRREGAPGVEMRSRRTPAFAVLLAIGVACGCAGAGSDDLGPAPGAPRPYEPDPAVETRVVVPEVYELANVAIAISDYGIEAPWAVEKEGAYYERVLERFRAHSDHALIRVIDPAIAGSYRDYYGFRENAFSYRYDDDGHIVHGGEHFDVWSPDLFTRHLDLVEDFARTSGFREFHAAERETYAGLVERYREMVDLPAMAGWLHARFPGRRMDRYTVVFSPLIRGSHSTRNFARGGEREAVMFIAGPGLTLGDVGEAARRGLHERVVFTEIDHNYVDAVTAAFQPQVGRVFSDWRAWNTGEGYASPALTFNEYMTWAVFTLYAADTYAVDTFRDVNRRTERQMVRSRGFTRYREFNRELLRLYREFEPATVSELYGPILEWAAATYGSDRG